MNVELYPEECDIVLTALLDYEGSLKSGLANQKIEGDCAGVIKRAICSLHSVYERIEEAALEDNCEKAEYLEKENKRINAMIKDDCRFCEYNGSEFCMYCRVKNKQDEFSSKWKLRKD